MTADRADRLLTDLLCIVNNRFTPALRRRLLARIRDELAETKLEGFNEAMEMRHAENE
jgi:hypothetical protein